MGLAEPRPKGRVLARDWEGKRCLLLMPCRMDEAQRVPEIPEWEELKVLASLAPRLCGLGPVTYSL